MKSRERKISDICTKCHGPLFASRAFAGPSLVQGKLYCEPCAARMRFRVRAALVGAAALTVSAIGAGIVLAVTNAPMLGSRVWSLPFIAAAEYGLVFGGGIFWMKRQNVAVLRRLKV